MRVVDLHFFEMNVVRNLYLCKYIFLDWQKKSYCIPSLTCVHLLFFILNTTDPDELCSSNYFYLFRYFFRCKASICQYTSEFHLGVWYYTFQIRAYIKDFNCFFILYFLLNDIIPKIGKDFTVQTVKNKYQIILLDLNIFVDWNSSIGLFNLQHNLEFNFIFTGGTFYTGAQLVAMYKL